MYKVIRIYMDRFCKVTREDIGYFWDYGYALTFIKRLKDIQGEDYTNNKYDIVEV